MKLPYELQDYTLVERIGTGGMGAVYRAECSGPMGIRQEVAIKMLVGSAGMGREELGKRLLDEARILSQIEHPNIVRVRDLLLVEDELFGRSPAMVMDLVRGATLWHIGRELHRAGQRLPLDCVLHLALQAADALQHAHRLEDQDGKAMGLVHRDLKPGNLMVTQSGDLQMLDFGVAWARDRLAEATLVGELRGTYRYMAPEQAEGEQVDRRCDLYALGLILFELLAGERYVRLPSDGVVGTPNPSPPALLLAAVKTKLADRLPALRVSLREQHGLSEADAEAVEDVLVGLLQTRPADRFNDAAALARRLEPLAARGSAPRGRRLAAAVVRGGALGLEQALGRERALRRTAAFGASRAGAVREAGAADGAGGGAAGAGMVRGPASWLGLGFALGIAATLVFVVAGNQLNPGRIGTETERELANGPVEVDEDGFRIAAVGDGPGELPLGGSLGDLGDLSDEGDGDGDGGDGDGGDGDGLDGAATADPSDPGAGRPRSWFDHRTPKGWSDGGSIMLRVALYGEPVDCRPVLVHRPSGRAGEWQRLKAKGKGSSTRGAITQGAGKAQAAWTIKLPRPRPAQAPAGIEYFLQCEAPDGSVPVNWRSEANPGWLRQPPVNSVGGDGDDYGGDGDDYGDATGSTSPVASATLFPTRNSPYSKATTP